MLALKVNSLRLGQGLRVLSKKLKPPAFKPFSSTSCDWPTNKVRTAFVDYFQNKHKHVFYPSSSLIPHDDNSLLFANAGMNQFKQVFTETCDPSSPIAKLTRAVNSQKCIRAGGKHNDLDDVGKDTYHHTFFEMLGTWSFGDYFKKDAIEWAFDLLVNVYGLPKDRLYVSYFKGDDAMGIPCDEEARNFWLRFLPPERVLPFDKKANFWEMGETGPCGPCSEIHFDRIGGRDAAHLVNADDPDVIEIWNLVFIQFDRLADGSLRPLPRQHVDTGMGLERLISVLQNKRSNYDTDVFTALLTGIEQMHKIPPYSGLVGPLDAKQGYRDLAYRVVADHMRALCLAIADGALPSNEGRGYVVRRLLRRAIKYNMQTLAGSDRIDPNFSLKKLVPLVVQSLGDVYPEVRVKEEFIQALVEEEERAFSALLVRGTRRLEQLTSMASAGVLSGKDAFYLYGTMGLPVDLTQILAAERGWTVNVNEFNAAVEEERQRGKVNQQSKYIDGQTRPPMKLDTGLIARLRAQGIPATNDSPKYDIENENGMEAIVQGVLIPTGDTLEVQGVNDLPGDGWIAVLLDKSPFYSEAGGQESDHGAMTVVADGTEFTFQVHDAQVYGGYVVHICRVAPEDLQLVKRTGGLLGKNVRCSVDLERRQSLAAHHSATHLLHFWLRKIFGDSVSQRGSLVADDRLRFDFTCPKALTADNIKVIEESINTAIRRASPVETNVMPLSAATALPGVCTLAGEKYPDPVRVVKMGGGIDSASLEFCGGTHIRNTAEMAGFAVTDESSIAKGIRRIQAVTGYNAAQLLLRNIVLEREIEHLKEQQQLAQEPAAMQTAISRARNILELPASHWAKMKLRDAVDSAVKTFSSLSRKHNLAQFQANAAEALKDLDTADGKAVRVVRVPAPPEQKYVFQLMRDLCSKLTPSVSLILVVEDSARGHMQLLAQSGTGVSSDLFLRNVLQLVNGHFASNAKEGIAMGSVNTSVTDLDLYEAALKFL